VNHWSIDRQTITFCHMLMSEWLCQLDHVDDILLHHNKELCPGHGLRLWLRNEIFNWPCCVACLCDCTWFCFQLAGLFFRLSLL
jgi:hypothetical protein